MNSEKSNSPSTEDQAELFNLQNTENGRCGVFFGNTKDEAVDVASEFWETTPSNIIKTPI